MLAFGWAVLALVFLDELAAMAAFGVWGWDTGSAHGARLLLVWLLPLVAMLTWFFLASPKARFGGPVIRPVAKVLVFGLAALALDDAGHPVWALALLVVSIVVNGLAMIPSIRSLADDSGPAGGSNSV